MFIKNLKGNVGILILGFLFIYLIFGFSQNVHAFSMGEKIYKHAVKLEKQGKIDAALKFYRKATMLLSNESSNKKLALEKISKLTSKTVTDALVLNPNNSKIDDKKEHSSVKSRLDLPTSLTSITQKEIALVHKAVQGDYEDFFKKAVKALESGHVASAKKLLSPLVFIPTHSFTRGKLFYLLGLVEKQENNLDKSLEYLINGVLDYPILSNIRSFGFRNDLEKKINNEPKGNYRYILTAVQAFIDKKTDPAVNAFKMISKTNLDKKKNQIYIKLKNAIGLKAMNMGATTKRSALVNSMELKADNSFKRGMFKKAAGQYSYLLKRSPDSTGILIKMKAAKELSQIENLEESTSQAFSQINKIYSQEVYSLPFTAFRSSQLNYEDLLLSIKNKEYKKGLKISEGLLCNPFLSGTMSKIMYQKAIIHNYLKQPVMASRAYALSVLMNRDILAQNDNGILDKVLLIEDKNKFVNPLFPSFCRAVDLLVKSSLQPARQTTATLLEQARKSGDFEFMIYSVWLMNVINIEMGMNIVKGASALKKGNSNYGSSGPMADLDRIPVRVKNAPKNKQATWRYGDLPDPENETGDFDGDGQVSSTDLKILRRVISGKFRSIPEVCEVADVNGDGEVNKYDYELAVWKFNKTPGDFDGDGIISMDDINVIRNAKSELKKITVPFEQLHSSEQERIKELKEKADVNKDGKFDSLDYNAIMTYRRLFIGTRQF